MVAITLICLKMCCFVLLLLLTLFPRNFKRFQSVNQLPVVSTWKETDNSPSSETKIITVDFQYSSPVEETQESRILTRFVMVVSVGC